MAPGSQKMPDNGATLLLLTHRPASECLPGPSPQTVLDLLVLGRLQKRRLCSASHVWVQKDLLEATSQLQGKFHLPPAHTLASPPGSPTR